MTRKTIDNDPSTAQVLNALSTPVPAAKLVGPDLSRRRFLQASAAAATVSMLPAWMADHAGAATPIGADEGAVVLLTMAGGNDGLNTFVPINDGAYYDARPRLAIRPDRTLAMTGQRGLNSRLPFMKQLWDQGRVAVVEGVGRPDPDLSHFVSMARVMGASSTNNNEKTGWLGRYLDGLSADPFNGIALGTSVPQVVRGRRHRATAIPRYRSNFFATDPDEPTFGRQYSALQSVARRSSGLGPLADQMADGIAQAINLSDVLFPLVGDKTDEPKLVVQMRLAARLINANLGIRVLSVVTNDFDSHADQTAMHNERMDEINAALQVFYQTLHSSFESRTLVVGTSEFGRRIKENGSGGTDHGTANSMFLIGSGVRAGFHGQAPSLSNLDRRGNTKATVDYRHLYANIVERWLRADAAAVIGRDYGDLGILGSPGRAPASTSPSTPVTVATRQDTRAEVARLYLAYFQRTPDDDGHDYWVEVRRSGRTLRQISAEFVSSAEFQRRYGSLDNRQFVDLVYRNVLGRSPDGEGLNYWTGLLNRGGDRGEVMVGFSESNEFKTKTANKVARVDEVGPVGRLYRAYFLRAADRNGLDYWINSDLPAAAVSDQFALSPEFTRRYGQLNNEQFVRMAYVNVLGREPDRAGRNHWVGELNRGTSRGKVMLGFSNSAEFVKKVQRM